MIRNDRKGFTLIELLVVVSIIGVLATIIISSLGQARTKARSVHVATQLKAVEKGLFLAVIEENRVGFWTESELGFGNPNISSLLNISSGPGSAISNYLTENQLQTISTDSLRYDNDNNNVASNCSGSGGVNIFTTFGSLTQQELENIDIILDGEVDLSCGRFRRLSDTTVLYTISGEGGLFN